MTEQVNNGLSPNKQALLKIRELKQQLAAAEQGAGESIAIVSMACRFPRRSRTPEAFWTCLMQQTDEVSEIPEDRWDLDAFYNEDPDYPGRMYARKGVFLDNLDLMDPEFFGISPREATWVDPQQRLLMEVGWEALERAGWPAEKIGEQTGIFVGWMHNDYQNEASDSFLNLNPYIATGAAGSFLCGRLAYYLGLQGPSIAVDTACSSSLVALHLACQSLQRGDCERAVVGGVNAIVSPTTNILTCKLKALSPSGHSRAFDAAADGYLRGEGCGVVTLRRLSDAERAGDPILGIIRASAVGHNGASSGLTAPNPKAQEKVIRQALQRADVDPAEVAYLEAHGTGTELGDPIELQAAAAALAQDRDASNPLLIGSVKTNIGHLEAAAGMAGLIKVLLAIEHQQIPAQLNFEEPNPHIPWDQLAVKVVTSATDWPNTQGRQIANVSAFGMSGTNAHVVIEAPSADRTQVRVGADIDGEQATNPQLLVLSGKSEEALQELADRFERHLSTTNQTLADIAYTTCVGRSHLDHRAALVVRNRHQAVDKLKALGRLGQAESLFHSQGRRAPKVAWQFTGQGSQYVGMGRQLYLTQDVFRDAIDHCDRMLQESRQASLTEVLFEDTDLINHTSWTQPAIFALQMGLARLLESWGLKPDVVLGHSVGQYAAACAAGIMSWDDGFTLICERGRLIGDLPAGGQMLAVFAPFAAVENEISDVTDVSLAALNGTHVVVSGPAQGVAEVARLFAQRSIKTKLLKTSHAFHSSLMDPVLAPFQAVADRIRFQPGRLPLVCNVTGAALGADTLLDGAYWAGHIREPVRFSASIDAVQQMGCEVVLELGPQSVLTRMSAANWKSSTDKLISCLQSGADDVESLLQAVGQLYVAGASPDFESIYAGGHQRRIVLPTYPFQRRRFWGPDKPRAFHAAYHTAHPLLGSKVALAGVTDETRYESFIEADSPPWLPDHQVMGQVVMPGAAYVEMALAAADNRQPKDLVFEQPLHASSRTALQTVVRKSEGGGATLEIFSAPAGDADWTRNFRCRLVDAAVKQSEPFDRGQLEANCTETASPAEFYHVMQELGLAYGRSFQTIASIRYAKNEVLTHLQAKVDSRGFTLSPTLLDGALHSLAVGLLRGDDEHLFLPVGIGQVHVYQGLENEAWCHARWTRSDGKLRTADITLVNDAGQVIAEIEALQVQQISRAALRHLSGAGSQRLLYELDWQSFRLPAATSTETEWLLVDADRGETSFARQVAGRLRERGHAVCRLSLERDAEFELLSDTHVIMCSTAATNWERLFEHFSTTDAPFSPDGIAWIFDSADKSIAPGQLPKATQLHCTGLLHLVATLQQRGLRGLKCGLQLITRDAIAVSEDSCVDANQTQYWGFGRVLGAEQPEMRCRLIDVAAQELSAPQTATAVMDVLLTETRDSQLVIRGDQFAVARLKQSLAARNLESTFTANPAASYLITGGLGKLGRQAAKWLAEQGATQVVLVSRSAPDEAAEAFLGTIRSLGCEVVVHSASISSSTDVKTLCDRFGDDLKPLAGVIHAAGVLDDGLIGDSTWERFEKVLAPKVIGAALLHEHTKSLPLDFFILYSSAAGVLGSPGQSNYATANAYLDGLAWQRRSLGLPALSIDWGPWTEGMADDERVVKRLSLQGITPLSNSEAHDLLGKMLAAQHVQTTVIDADWQRMQLSRGGESPAMLDALVSAKQKAQARESELVVQLKRLQGASQRELLVKTIRELLQVVLSTPEPPETDRPLIEMGLDSLMAVEFGTELQLLLGDHLGISPTMLFDHPTIDAISDHVLELIVSDDEGPTTDPSEPAPRTAETARAVRDDVAIIGMSCRFPGARDVDEFWQNLLDKVDSVCEIPEDRWDIDRFYSAAREPGKMATREGGFLDDIADFDADFFNISDQEACWIDPQHRMLLENSYRALEDAGVSPHPLADSNVGVFMGIMGQDYAFLPSLDDEEIIQGFQGAGLSHSAGVGRISYLFGFEGPSMAIDTASSSSLVALLQAVRSLQDGNCNMALAGGVNAILAPVNSLLMSKAGLLSPDGRCKSFSTAADGFGRGEGCGVVVLKRLSDAERDGDRIMAVVRGGAVVHNGFSGGITSPSGKSQARVIAEALKDASLAPSQVQYLEAHGTGTEFGDPMELGAAASVYGKGRQQANPLMVGSVKANISHLEAAGGVSGLIKTVLSLQQGIIPPQIHFDKPSPHIPWARLPIKMASERTEWPEAEERIAGITALGLVGTNAHVILSAAAARRDEQAGTGVSRSVRERPTHLLVFSARNDRALTQLATDYSRYIESHPQADLADICFTLATGRRHHEHRIAITASSREEMLRKLSSIGANQALPGAADGRRPGLQNGHARPAAAASSNGKGFEPPQAGIAMNVSRAVPTIAWVFAGDRASGLHGGLETAKVRELFQLEPVFRELIASFDQRLAEHGVKTNQSFDRLQDWFEAKTLSQQPSDVHVFALQAGLARVWQSWAIEPATVLGCGVGQYTAACVAGGLCFLDALTLVVEREKIVGHFDHLRQSSNQTFSESDLPDQWRASLDRFEAFADTINYYPPNLPLICSLSASLVPVHRSLGGSYWRQHCLNAPQESASLQRLFEQGCDCVLELAPPWSTQTDNNSKVAWLKCLVEGQGATTSMLESLARLYVGGCLPDFQAFDRHWPRKKLSLPTYPFQKKRYWITEMSDHVKPVVETIES